MGEERAGERAGQERMLAEVERELAETAAETGVARLDPRIREAIAATPRERFVDHDHRPRAYDNTPLPLGHGQTISQPFIVALMTQLAAPGPEDKVLDVGTGSGWQAAILARLAREVHGLEVIPELARQARSRLQALGLENVVIHEGDGWRGLPEAAPFDVIVVAAAAPEIPPALEEQLAPGGRLVIPVGPTHGRQWLTLVEKDAQGHLHRRRLLPVAFVPLVRPPG